MRSFPTMPRFTAFVLIATPLVAALLATSVPAAMPVAAKAADSTRPATPLLGVNLEGVTDWARSMMFVDLIKSARQFGSPDAPWDEKAPVDKDGWPTADAGAVVVADAPVPPGDYTFACTGRCNLGVVSSPAKVKGLRYDSGSNTTTAVVSVPEGTTGLFLSFRNTVGGVKNIRLFRPGYPLTTDQVFNKDFLAALAPYSAIRLMDYLRTNQSKVREWSERAKPTDARQSSEKGAAWEYAIMLANTTGKDLWINVPVGASDDYVKQLAQLFKSKLNKDRAIYIEYSNEVWNTIFPQFQLNYEAAKAEVAAGDKLLNDGGQDPNSYYWGWKRVAKRLVEISRIFQDVYAQPGTGANKDALNTIVRPVLASQAAQPLMLRKQLEFIEKNYGPPAKVIYGIAGAPYIGPEEAMRDKDGTSADDLLQSTSTKGMQWISQMILQYQALARWYRLHSLCYEGGLDFSGDHSLNAKIALNRDPRIGKLLQDYLNVWYSSGGELFMYFNLSGAYNKFGCWGTTEDIRKQTPKTKAIALVKAEPLPPLNVGTAVPGVIQAAQDNGHDGGGTEDSSDGGKIVAYLKAGNSFDYLLNVKNPGEYALTLQTGSDHDGGAIEVVLDGRTAGNLTTRNTGGWHTWGNTAPLMLHLEKGQVVMRLRIAREGMNIRSITFK